MGGPSRLRTKSIADREKGRKLGLYRVHELVILMLLIKITCGSICFIKFVKFPSSECQNVQLIRPNFHLVSWLCALYELAQFFNRRISVKMSVFFFT